MPATWENIEERTRHDRHDEEVDKQLGRIKWEFRTLCALGALSLALYVLGKVGVL